MRKAALVCLLAGLGCAGAQCALAAAPQERMAQIQNLKSKGFVEVSLQSGKGANSQALLGLAQALSEKSQVLVNAFKFSQANGLDNELKLNPGVIVVSLDNFAEAKKKGYALSAQSADGEQAVLVAKKDSALKAGDLAGKKVYRQEGVHPKQAAELFGKAAVAGRQLAKPEEIAEAVKNEGADAAVMSKSAFESLKDAASFKVLAQSRALPKKLVMVSAQPGAKEVSDALASLKGDQLKDVLPEKPDASGDVFKSAGADDADALLQYLK